jgi:hypothetical protein
MLNIRGMSTVENFPVGANKFGHGLTSDYAVQHSFNHSDVMQQGDAPASVLERMLCPLMAPDPQAVDPASQRWQYNPRGVIWAVRSWLTRGAVAAASVLPRGPGAHGKG